MRKIRKASELGDKFAKVVDDVADSRVKAIIVKDGVVVAEIVPAPIVKKKPPESIIGAMKGSIVMHDDLVEPAWDGDFGDAK